MTGKNWTNFGPTCRPFCKGRKYILRHYTKGFATPRSYFRSALIRRNVFSFPRSTSDCRDFPRKMVSWWTLTADVGANAFPFCTAQSYVRFEINFRVSRVKICTCNANDWITYFRAKNYRIALGRIFTETIAVKFSQNVYTYGRFVANNLTLFRRVAL